MTADLSTREVLPSVSYLSVIQENQRKGLSSLWTPIREEKALLQQILYVKHIVFSDTVAFQRNKEF